MDVKEVGGIIKKRRRFLQVDQKSLAEISGVAVYTISDIESGKGNPTGTVLIDVLDALGMELSVRIKEPIGYKEF